MLCDYAIALDLLFCAIAHDLLFCAIAHDLLFCAIAHDLLFCANNLHSKATLSSVLYTTSFSDW